MVMKKFRYVFLQIFPYRNGFGDSLRAPALKGRGHFLRMACAGFEIRCHSMLTGPLGTGPRSPGSMQEGTGTLQEG